MQSKYTKGIWRLESAARIMEDDRVMVGGDRIATVHVEDVGPDQAAHNGYLIEMAPDLLTSLMEMLEQAQEATTRLNDAIRNGHGLAGQKPMVLQGEAQAVRVIRKALTGVEG